MLPQLAFQSTNRVALQSRIQVLTNVCFRPEADIQFALEKDVFRYET